MEENPKDIEKLLSQAKNYKVVAIALALQGVVLLLSGVFIAPVLALFGLKFNSIVEIGFQIAFIASGVVDLAMAFYFYKKSRILID